MSLYRILNNERGGSDLRLKIVLLVFSILIPFLVVDTIILKSLSRQMATLVSDGKHLAMLGSSFFRVFMIKALMALVVTFLVVCIAFWIVSPGRNLGRKVIRTLGKGTRLPQGGDEVRYAMELLDKVNNAREARVAPGGGSR